MTAAARAGGQTAPSGQTRAIHMDGPRRDRTSGSSQPAPLRSYWNAPWVPEIERMLLPVNVVARLSPSDGGTEVARDPADLTSTSIDVDCGDPRFLLDAT